MSLESIVIVAAKRAPMGGFMRVLIATQATDLGATATKPASVGVNGVLVNEVIMDCVLPLGLGQAPARQAALKAGLPLSAGVTALAVEVL